MPRKRAVDTAFFRQRAEQRIGGVQQFDFLPQPRRDQIGDLDVQMAAAGGDLLMQAAGAMVPDILEMAARDVEQEVGRARPLRDAPACVMESMAEQGRVFGQKRLQRDPGGAEQFQAAADGAEQVRFIRSSGSPTKIGAKRRVWALVSEVSRPARVRARNSHASMLPARARTISGRAPGWAWSQMRANQSSRRKGSG